MDDTAFPQLEFNLSRGSSFSFECKRCTRCCHHKAILIGPYEIVRLARGLGVSTTEFLKRFADPGGIALRIGTDGACVFLSSDGCRVHPDRPLVCRLYPLARRIDFEGLERFGQLPLHPECAGRLAAEETVESYLSSQDVAPYLEHERRYTAIYQRMVNLLGRLERQAEGNKGQTSEQPLERNTEFEDGLLSPWLDVDATVAAHCREHNMSPPQSVAEVIDLHLLALRAWVDRFE